MVSRFNHSLENIGQNSKNIMGIEKIYKDFLKDFSIPFKQA
jgi:hypothetical protein